MGFISVMILGICFSSWAQTYEAEDAYYNNAVVESDHTGYTGSGYVNTANEVGTYIEWTITSSSSGSAQCAFRYANGADSRPVQLSVNNSTVVSSQDFPPTGAWTTWQFVTVTVNINQGTNTIRLTTLTAEGAANIDRLDITIQGSTIVCGDSNGSGIADIVDALLIAQYYVGLNPGGFDASASDVNGDGTVDIVDALMVAQYYVGLISELTGCPVATPIPTSVPKPHLSRQPRHPEIMKIFIVSTGICPVVYMHMIR